MVRKVELRAAAKGISAWGIVGLVLLLRGEYNLYMYDEPADCGCPFVVAKQICIVVLLAAVVCGVIPKSGRGSKR